MNNKKKVIFICTGNSCRSQIAEGLLRHLADKHFDVYSAGTYPSRVHKMSIKVMKEIYLDISNHTSDPLDKYFGEGIDYVITLCDNAKEFCPTFPGNSQKIHWSIKDPFKSWNDDEKSIRRYRRTRKDLQKRIEKFIKQVT